MRNKGFIVLFIINMALLIMDLISTLRVGDVAKYLETNIFYQHIGFFGVYILNIIIFLLAYYLYRKGNVNNRFILLFFLVVLMITRTYVIINNYTISLDPPTIDEAMSVTAEMKLEYNLKTISMNIFPILYGIITYFFYRLDHTIKKRGDSHQ